MRKNAKRCNHLWPVADKREASESMEIGVIVCKHRSAISISMTVPIRCDWFRTLETHWRRMFLVRLSASPLRVVAIVKNSGVCSLAILGT